jgi:hypothetical protein
MDYYEVEFRTPARSTVRALIKAEMLEVLEHAPASGGHEVN